jgi:hypothetical protein
MRRKIVLALLLCLAVAGLGIGAAPALAADGCDCHTVEPLTAPTPHAPFVAGVTDCTVCHVGWTVPHPTAVAPTLTATVVTVGGIFKSNTVRGGLAIPWVPLTGVAVYVQMMRPAATEYTDVGTCTTNWRGMCFSKNAGEGTVRCISRGVAGPPVVMPALSVAPGAVPTPRITARLRGPTAGILKLGRRVTLTGRVRPLALAGQVVIIQYTGRRAGKSTEHAQVKRTIRAAGTYRWTFRPKYRGKYIIKAFVPKTSAYTMERARALSFRVK